MGEHNDAQDWQNYWAMKTAAGGFFRLEANDQNPPRLGVLRQFNRESKYVLHQ